MSSRYTKCLLAAVVLVCAGCWRTGEPAPGRMGAAMAVDQPNRRALHYGGIGGHGSYVEEVWVLSLDNFRWKIIDVGGESPGVRARHSMVYDRAHGRMVMFGGNDRAGALHGDVWALNLGPGGATWERLETSGTGPSPRTLATAVYCPPRHSMIVYGGASADTTEGDVFELDLDNLAWRELAAGGTRPPARNSAGGFYDSLTNSMVVFGGLQFYFCNDLWSLDLTPGSERWESMPARGVPPEPRAGYVWAWVPGQRRFYVTMGWAEERDSSTVHVLDLADTSWTRQMPSGEVPRWRRYAATAFDPFGGNVLVYGGDLGYGHPVSDSLRLLRVVDGLEWRQLPEDTL